MQILKLYSKLEEEKDELSHREAASTPVAEITGPWSYFCAAVHLWICISKYMYRAKLIQLFRIQWTDRSHLAAKISSNFTQSYHSKVTPIGTLHAEKIYEAVVLFVFTVAFSAPLLPKKIYWIFLYIFLYYINIFLNNLYAHAFTYKS